jgi:hypothetical protein
LVLQNFPRNVPLGDDTLLESATYRDDIKFTPLAVLDQAIILGMLSNHFYSDDI